MKADKYTYICGICGESNIGNTYCKCEREYEKARKANDKFWKESIKEAKEGKYSDMEKYYQ